jgi:hypothetical protein
VTEEQVIKGKEICDSIKSLEKDCESLEILSTYINEQKGGSLEIQLHEKWVSTPYAKVNKTNLLGFLNCEKHRIRLEIKSLKEKLEAM